MLDSGLDLRTVEHRGAVNSAIADEDDIAVLGEPICPGELHVCETGAALEPEDRLRRVIREGPDARHRKRDEPGLRIGPVLRHDERPAVRCIAPVLGGVGTRIEEQVAGERSFRDRHRLLRRRELHVGQAEKHQPDEDESDDSCACEAGHGGFLSGSAPGPEDPGADIGLGGDRGRRGLRRRLALFGIEVRAATRASSADTSSSRRAASSKRAGAPRGRWWHRAGRRRRARRRTA